MYVLVWSEVTNSKQMNHQATKITELTSTPTGPSRADGDPDRQDAGTAEEVQ